MHFLQKTFRKSFVVLVGALGVLAASVAMSAPVQAAPGAVRYVAASGTVGSGNSCASPGFVGSTGTAIQAAIDAANSGDAVRICAGTYSIGTRLEVTKSLTIEGDGASVTTLDGLGTTQIMIIQDNNLTPNSGSEITVDVIGLSFINGYAVARPGATGDCDDGSKCGGAIYVESESRFGIIDCYFKNNYASFIGGAVARLIGNYQTVPGFITNSTFESNTAVFDGGAVATLFGFGLTIESSTFYQNKITSRSAAAVIANFASATINNSTFVDNTGPAGTTVLYGSITVNHSVIAQSSSAMIKACNGSVTVSGSRGNLVTDNSCSGLTSTYPAVPATDSSIVGFPDLKLGSISYRGYANKTIPLLPGSVAIDFWSGCSVADQHGFSRPQGGSCDVGAYERPASQTVNSVTGWSYPSSTIDRANGASVSVTSSAADNAGLGVSYSTSTSSVCTVNEFTGTVTLLTTGVCNLTASSLGNLLNDQDQISRSLTIVGVFPPTVSSVPVVSGTNRAGMALTSTSGSWSNSPTSYTYRWMSAATSNGTYSDIANANSSTYELAQDDVGRYIKVSVVANNSSGASSASMSSVRGPIADFVPGLAPVLSTATSTNDGFTFSITNFSASYTYSATTTRGSVSLVGADGVVTGLSANGSATVTVTSSRPGYSTLSATRQGSTVVTTTTTTSTTVPSTTTTVTTVPTVVTTVATSPVVTVAQGQASVATIAPSAGPTTTVLVPIQAETPRIKNAVIPQVATTIANAQGAIAPDAPSLSPGESGAIVDGKKITTTVSRSENQVIVSAGDITTTISGIAADGTRISLNADGNLVLQKGQKFVINADGFAAQEPLTVWMYSTPTQLGAITTSSDGKAAGTFNLPDGLEEGNHRVVLEGKNKDGQPAVIAIGISYGAEKSGSSIARVLIAIPVALAILFGLLLPAVSRRRKREVIA